MTHVLDQFSPAVAEWFRGRFGDPTPPQTLGWPRIAGGENTLILAPTGSGKTLAAFLWMIDELSRRAPSQTEGVTAVYVSPLRALAADVERNLEEPLAGIREASLRLGAPAREVRVAMRTGDTPPAERARMVRRPPDLLITTPESLHLLLTARRPREILRSVRYVIVDEIHTLCDEKRGSFLALLLERLERLAGRPLVRVGLSATQRPLDRVARFLGGYGSDGSPRPVAVVDCGGRKDLDLRVIAPVPDLRVLPHDEGQAASVWPAIYRLLLDLTRAHRSTLIFANNRRAVERIAAEMNRLAGRRLVRAHHGSVAKEYRREIEGELKAGRLPALVATASLELGIDMGAIDLVCQVETPTSVSSGLQRVGRAGHALGRTSVGRLIPKTRADLLRMAGMARAMRRGEISSVRVPQNPLDVLAQQLVAMVAAEEWTASDLYGCVRGADPFHALPRTSFDAVLDMIAGGYESPAFPGLRARVLWERTSDRVSSLPGALRAAIAAGGTIPDTGQFAMVLEDGTTRLGELDEEFVFERRVGETFVLGTGRWRILDIRLDRVVVAPSALEEAQLPFWKGEGLGHDAEFGARLGEFVAECAARQARGDLTSWLEKECSLDEAAAAILSEFVGEQSAAGGLPDDRTILVEAFPNEAGDLRVAIVSTFGRSFHLALWMVLRAELRARDLPAPDGIVSNDGILLRPGSLDIADLMAALSRLGDGRARGRLIAELEGSPYFALRFRRNAGRALLVPRSQPGKRVPLWLQRLRSHDLLSYASAHPRFPMVLETYREILEDALPVEELEAFAAGLESGETRFVLRRSAKPSPLAGTLVVDFVGKYMYEPDRPAPRATRPDGDLLGDLLRPADGGPSVSEDAMRTMDERLQGVSAFHRARDGAEVVDLLRRVGDLTDEELRARCEPEAEAAISALAREGRIVQTESALFDGLRWIGADDAARYRSPTDSDRAAIVVRHILAHAGLRQTDLAARYPGAGGAIDDASRDERLVTADLPGRAGALIDRDVLIGLRRMTLAKSRRAASPAPFSAFAAWVLRKQHVEEPLSGTSGLRDVLEQLAGWLAPVTVWPEILEARVADSGRIRVDPLVRGGAIEWRGALAGGTRLVGFAPAGSGSFVLPAPAGDPEPAAREVLEVLTSRGASFLAQIAEGLGRPSAAVDQALWELTWAGWVTNDSLAAAWRAGPGRVRPTPGLGRWSAVSAGTATGGSEEETAAQLRILAGRYGVLCRELLARDPAAPRWADAYPVLSRMEWRGEIERGHFVSGMSGPQFAVPGAAAEMKREAAGAALRLLHVMDPALVAGDVAPRAEFPRRGPGSYVVVRGGEPVLAIESRARRLVPLADLIPAERREALGLLAQLVRRPGQPPSIRVERWGDAPAAESEAASDLESLGFLREDRAMILYRSFGVAP